MGKEIHITHKIDGGFEIAAEPQREFAEAIFYSTDAIDTEDKVAIIIPTTIVPTAAAIPYTEVHTTAEEQPPLGIGQADMVFKQSYGIEALPFEGEYASRVELDFQGQIPGTEKFTGKSAAIRGEAGTEAYIAALGKGLVGSHRGDQEAGKQQNHFLHASVFFDVAAQTVP